MLLAGAVNRVKCCGTRRPLLAQRPARRCRQHPFASQSHGLQGDFSTLNLELPVDRSCSCWCLGGYAHDLSDSRRTWPFHRPGQPCASGSRRARGRHACSHRVRRGTGRCASIPAAAGGRRSVCRTRGTSPEGNKHQHLDRVRRPGSVRALVRRRPLPLPESHPSSAHPQGCR